MTRDDAVSLILEALGSLNKEREADAQIALSESTELLTDSSQLDSLAFVSFTSDLEDRLTSKVGREMSLVDSALGDDNAAFRTVGSLADHIAAETGA